MKSAKTSGLSIALIFLLALSVSAQDLWTHIYEGPGGNFFGEAQVAPFSGGGFICAARCEGQFCDDKRPVYIWKTDSHGNLLWAKQVMEDSQNLQLIEGNEGIFFLMTSPVDSPTDIIIKFDGDGNILSQKEYYPTLDYGGVIIRGSNGILYGLDQYGLAVRAIDQTTLNVIFNKYYNRIGEGLYSRDIKEAKDGGLYLAGFSEDCRSAKVIKTNLNGNVIWSRLYGPEVVETYDTPRIAATADGGLLLATLIDVASTVMDETCLIRMDKDGNIIWQEELVFSKYPNMTPAVLGGVYECNDGTILVWGLTGCGDPGYCSSPFLASLNSTGEPIWFMGSPGGISSDWLPVLSGLFETADGFVLSEEGFGNDPRSGERIFGSILGKYSYDYSGEFNDCYYPLTDVLSAEPTYYTFSESEVNERDVGVDIFPSQVNPTNMEVKDTVGCGEQWPGIMSVVKKTSPLRLKLTGWNFEKGSSVYVNGVKAGKTTFKGRDDLNRTKLVVIGSGLKALLPKGQSVCITVKNPDGHESDCFTFTR